MKRPATRGSSSSSAGVTGDRRAVDRGAAQRLMGGDVDRDLAGLILEVDVDAVELEIGSSIGRAERRERQRRGDGGAVIVGAVLMEIDVAILTAEIGARVTCTAALRPGLPARSAVDVARSPGSQHLEPDLSAVRQIMDLVGKIAESPHKFNRIGRCRI